MHRYDLQILAASDLAHVAGLSAFASRSSVTKAKTTTKTV